MTNPAAAQLDQQTGIADPGRASEDLRDQLSLPDSTPNIQIREMSLIGAPEGADQIKLTFNGLQVEGNSVYSNEDVSALYADKIGQEVTLADVYGMANELTLKYRNDGYVLTQVVVPPQTIDSGAVRVQVVEGYIENVSIQADDESASEIALIESYARQLNKGGALNIYDMERHLLLINDLPGVRARSIISPSETTAGAADMLIIIERDAYDALISADNFGSRFLGQWTLGGVATFNSLFNQNEAITLQTAYAPGTGYELLYGGIGYEQPIGPHGTRIGGLVSITDTDPGFTLEQFDVRGKANLYSINLTHPFVRTRNENLEGRLVFDWRDVRTSNNIEPTRKDRIRALRAGFQYDFLDTLLGVAANSIDIEVSQGLNILGASEEDRGNLSRPSGDPQFTKAVIELQRLQRVTNEVSLQMIGRGQLANTALLSSEEFGVGGISSGRGYDPSEIVGDDGVAAQVELQWNNPIDLPTNQVVEKYQLYTFFDIGRIWNEDATTADDERHSLASTGVGARVNFTADVQAGVGVAFPLTRRMQAENDRDPRFYLNVSKKF